MTPTRERGDAAAWLAAAAPPAELLALWSDLTEAHALWRHDAALRLVSVPVEAGHYPALSPLHPAAAWFERAIADMYSHRAHGARDTRPWLDHGRWAVRTPMQRHPEAAQPDYDTRPEFPEVDGGTTLPVGPVHAGIIEPGHFHFALLGEVVGRLEIRLGYAHKGTRRLMQDKTPRAAARFAARLSGDSTVAHGVAFARAAEAATGTDAPPRAHALRGVAAELERVANHLGDLGALAGDVAHALLAARLGRLRETVLRASQAAFGHRLMMDAVIPGGMAADLTPEGAAAIGTALDAVFAALPDLLRMWHGTDSLTDRMVGAGVIPTEAVAAFAPGGVVGRASGRPGDLRVWPGYAPYEGPALQPALLRSGDVDARARLRLAELPASIGLVRGWLAALPDGPVVVPLPMAGGEGLGWAESFRGDCWCWLRLEGGLIAASFLRDPSWLHWPLLEAAMQGAVLADFPLVNKSINGSYSGVDL